MEDLLDDYKDTLKATRVNARVCEKVGNKEDALVHRAIERSLKYSIQWMSSGSEPQMYTPERQSYEKRKVSFDFNAVEGSLVLESSKMQRVVENVAQVTVSEGASEEELECQESKKSLVEAIKLSLTSRQIEVLELVSAGYTHEEVAKKLGVTRRAVGMSIDSSRRKIKEDGWMMV